jgi:hypothetical protein
MMNLFRNEEKAQERCDHRSSILTTFMGNCTSSDNPDKVLFDNDDFKSPDLVLFRSGQRCDWLTVFTPRRQPRLARPENNSGQTILSDKEML